VYILNSGSRFALVAEYITVSFGGRRVKWLAYEPVQREAVMRKGRSWHIHNYIYIFNYSYMYNILGLLLPQDRSWVIPSGEQSL
jgi:hypothetical protein